MQGAKARPILGGSSSSILGSLPERALLQQDSRAICPSQLALSSGEPEQPVHKAPLSRRPGFGHEALPFADHPHDLEAFDRRRCCGQRLEPSRWID